MHQFLCLVGHIRLVELLIILLAALGCEGISSVISLCHDVEASNLHKVALHFTCLLHFDIQIRGVVLMGRNTINVLVKHQSIYVTIVIQKLVIIGCLTWLLLVGRI